MVQSIMTLAFSTWDFISSVGREAVFRPHISYPVLHWAHFFVLRQCSGIRDFSWLFWLRNRGFVDLERKHTLMQVEMRHEGSWTWYIRSLGSWQRLWNHISILSVGLHWSVTLEKVEFRPGIEIIVCTGEWWWDSVPCGGENLSFFWFFNLDIVLLSKTGCEV